MAINKYPADSLIKILERFDPSSPESLIRSLAAEFVNLYKANALLEARLAAMETLQGLADRILEPGSGFMSVYPGQARIEANDSALEIVGFHELEHSPTGEPYRWTGPERQFSFQLFVDRRAPAVFELDFGKLYAPVPVERLRCFVDGKEIMLSMQKSAVGWHAKGAMAPRRDPGGTVLTFVVPQVMSPRSNGLDDMRLLGLSFQALNVETSATLAAALVNRSNPSGEDLDAIVSKSQPATPSPNPIAVAPPPNPILVARPPNPIPVVPPPSPSPAAPLPNPIKVEQKTAIPAPSIPSSPTGTLQSAKAANPDGGPVKETAFLVEGKPAQTVPVAQEVKL